MGTGRTGGDGGGFHGGGWGGTIPGVLMAIPQVVPQGGQVIDDADDPQGPRRQNSTRRTSSGVPPINERRYLPDEVVIELANTISRRRSMRSSAAAAWCRSSGRPRN